MASASKTGLIELSRGGIVIAVLFWLYIYIIIRISIQCYHRVALYISMSVTQYELSRCSTRSLVLDIFSIDFIKEGFYSITVVTICKLRVPRPEQYGCMAYYW